MAGSGGAVNTTTPQAYSYNPPPASNTYYNPPPANNTYYNPPPATTSSSTYGYPDQGSTSYYNYTAPATSTSGSNTTGNYNEYSAPKVSASTSSSTYGPAPSTASSYTGSNSYVVQKGDTVFQVMRNTGIYWKDIIRLNNLQAPNYSISAGQTLKLR
jgi:LysM repeat protein